MPTDLNQLPLSSLYETLSASGLVRRLLELAREEDLGPPEHGSCRPGDVTSLASIPADAVAVAEVSSRSGGIISGLAAIPEILDVFAPTTKFESFVSDGDRVSPDTALGFLSGTARQILRAERPLLNLIGRLSGIATLTARYVAAAGQTNAKIYDTRKTTPGLRVLEKYAVRCGGGHCHRIGLFDAVLIKDNHLARISLADLGAYVSKTGETARAINPDLSFIMVEVDSHDQLAQLLKLPTGTINIILLDNMSPDRLRKAVSMRDAAVSAGSARVELEASGGVNLETIREIASTGVDRISIGALTHQATSLDIGLDFKTSIA